MGRRRGTLGRVLICGGIAVLLVSFCSFRFIVTVAAIISIIVGTKIIICS
ncbi:MAG: hypothetical protein UHH95_00760 [Oscillospiraceae bacterium]|nr:hypothetical protein [Oscillospiraceae bacterium]